MRAGIDAHILGRQRGGVETCIEALIRAISRQDRENQYFIYVTADHPFSDGELPGNFFLRRLPETPRLVERIALIPYVYQRDRLDVIHLQRVLPPWGCRQSVLHLHDAIHARCPELFPAWKRALLTRTFRASGRKATLVITPTDASRRDIGEAYGIPPAKIAVVPNGIDAARFHPITDAALTRDIFNKHRLRAPYVIYAGGIERYKNVHLLIEAFAAFRREFPDYQLVTVGKWRSETHSGYHGELVARVAARGLENQVRFTGHVAAEDLPVLLAGAHMLVFPSIAEGFGFPPLEAMACGTPAIAADIPTAREVYGNAALLAKPGSVESLAEQMRRMAGDHLLRQNLIARGLERAAQFTWDAAATKLLEAYRAAAAGAAASSAAETTNV